jgi:hypothetical protein
LSGYTRETGVLHLDDLVPPWWAFFSPRKGRPRGRGGGKPSRPWLHKVSKTRWGFETAANCCSLLVLAVLGVTNATNTDDSGKPWLSPPTSTGKTGDVPRDSETGLTALRFLYSFYAQDYSGHSHLVPATRHNDISVRVATTTHT